MRQRYRGILRNMLALTAAAAVLCGLRMTAAAESQTGWQTENGRRFYLTGDGSRAVGVTEIDGCEYVFAPNGIQQVGWQTVSGKRWYYAPETGEPVFGTLHWRGEDYYITKETGKLTGAAETEEGRILPDAQGVLQKNGWYRNGEAWCYADAAGILAAGEACIDGVPCLFDAEGALQTGFQTDSAGVTRYYDPAFDAADTPLLRTGWLTAADAVYYLNADGSVQTGLMQMQGDIYDFDADGRQLTGWQTENDARYYFGDDARAVRGLTEIDGDTYYFDEDAHMVTGAVSLAVPYFFDADGRRIDGWHETEAGKTYCDPLNGQQVKGWQTIDGKQYYFDAAGIMLTGLQTIDGVARKFDADGVYHPVKICLDAGHFQRGNHSPVNSAYWEGDFTWKFHLMLKDALEAKGIEVITTRTDKDTDKKLEERGRCSEGCDLFLSIHSNACNNYAADGPIACCGINGLANDIGLKLANTIADVMQTNSRGSIWNRNDADYPDLDYYGVLRGATYVGTPAILLEHSYHTNYRATVWLLNDSNLRRLADAEANCLAAFFGLTGQ